MSAKRTKKPSKTEQAPPRGRADLKRLQHVSEEEIEQTSPPELTDLPPGFWDDAEVVYPPAKEAISLRVDRDVLTWFRERGPKYQTRMNAVLRSYMQSMEGRKRTRPPSSRKSRSKTSEGGAS